MFQKYSKLCQSLCLEDKHKYNKKFKFPFIIAVTGLNVAEIIKNFEIRLENTFDFELNEAIRQVHKIASIRIDQKIKLLERG